MLSTWLPILIASLALLMSTVTAWLIFYRRGELRMTQPTVIFIGPDRGQGTRGRRLLKVFLRTLLFSTARTGQTVESLHVNLQRGESRRTSPFGSMEMKRLLEVAGYSSGRTASLAITISFFQTTERTFHCSLASTCSAFLRSLYGIGQHGNLWP